MITGPLVTTMIIYLSITNVLFFYNIYYYTGIAYNCVTYSYSGFKKMYNYFTK